LESPFSANFLSTQNKNTCGNGGTSKTNQEFQDRLNPNIGRKDYEYVNYGSIYHGKIQSFPTMGKVVFYLQLQVKQVSSALFGIAIQPKNH